MRIIHVLYLINYYFFLNSFLAFKWDSIQLLVFFFFLLDFITNQSVFLKNARVNLEVKFSTQQQSKFGYFERNYFNNPLFYALNSVL